MKLIELVGGEKQVKWAENIRLKVIANFEKFLEQKKESHGYYKIAAAYEKMLTIDDSKWWIEHREYENYYIQKLWQEIYFQFIFKKEKK